ncbi:MAG: glutaredoxin family protein [Candidatus ainarchaeum sp.]|nr:glutaredoxin family protein [Candidatus ainarchaeum sp.]
MANIIMYTSTTCKFCDKLKVFFKQNNLAFEERNVKLDPKYAQELLQKSGGYGVPVSDIDGTIIVGYNLPKIKSALGMP